MSKPLKNTSKEQRIGSNGNLIRGRGQIVLLIN